MKVYKAKLYMVRKDVDYFTAKEFIEKETYMDGLSASLHKEEAYYFKNIQVGKEKYTDRLIFQTLSDYYRSICGEKENPYNPYVYKLMELDPPEWVKACSKASEYYDTIELIVRKQFHHRVEDIITGFSFPELVCSSDNFYTALPSKFLYSLKVFEANQRIYAHIIREMGFEEAETAINSITHEELERRTQAISYMIEEGKKRWQPIPSNPSFILKIYNKIEAMKKNDTQQLENDEKIKQYVKK